MTPALVVRGLKTGYGASRIVRDVSFDVDVGEVLCLMGRNGAGKTTLLKALMGVLPSQGSIMLGGMEIGGWKSHRIRAAGMVWVPQEDSVFPGLTVREHLLIAFGPAAAQSGTKEAIELFPPLATRLDQEADTLSGGERKMLGLAQALVIGPKVVLLDEPTEGVAPVVVQQLIPAIEALAERTAVVLVEQNIDTALALGRRAAILEHGTLVESGDLHSLHSDGVLESRLAL